MGPSVFPHLLSVVRASVPVTKVRIIQDGILS